MIFCAVERINFSDISISRLSRDPGASWSVVARRVRLAAPSDQPAPWRSLLFGRARPNSALFLLGIWVAAGGPAPGGDHDPNSDLFPTQLMASGRDHRVRREPFAERPWCCGRDLRSCRLTERRLGWQLSL